MLLQVAKVHFHSIYCELSISKVVFFCQCSKMQLISFQKFIIKNCFIQFIWFFRLKCWLKGQIISRIHLSLPNEYKLMWFKKKINGNRNNKFLEWYYWSLHWPKKFTLRAYCPNIYSACKPKFFYHIYSRLKHHWLTQQEIW